MLGRPARAHRGPVHPGRAAPPGRVRDLPQGRRRRPASVLTTIFGTGLYDRVTAHLDRARTEAGRARSAPADGSAKRSRPRSRRRGSKATRPSTCAASTSRRRTRAGRRGADARGAGLAARDRLRGPKERSSSRSRRSRRGPPPRRAASRAGGRAGGGRGHERGRAPTRSARPSCAEPGPQLPGPCSSSSSGPRRRRCRRGGVARGRGARGRRRCARSRRGRSGGRGDDRTAAGLGTLVAQEAVLGAARDELADLTSRLATAEKQVVELEEQALLLPSLVREADIRHREAVVTAAGLAAARSAVVVARDRLGPPTAGRPSCPGSPMRSRSSNAPPRRSSSSESGTCCSGSAISPGSPRPWPGSSPTAGRASCAAARPTRTRRRTPLTRSCAPTSRRRASRPVTRLSRSNGWPRRPRRARPRPRHAARVASATPTSRRCATAPRGGGRGRARDGGA